MIQFEVPDDMDRSSSNAFKFARINPSASSPSWDTGTLWNQAPGDGQNTSFKDGKNIFKLSDWNAGSWDGYYDSGSGDDESESVDTLPEVADGCRRVFYDATLSKLSYEGDSSAQGAYEIPKRGTNTVYCFADKSYTMTKLTSYSDGKGHTWTDVYYADIPENSTQVAFSNFQMSNIDNHGWSGQSTKTEENLQSIFAKYENPCFYADSSDDSIYKSNSSNQRGGYWAEAFTIRNAETGKDKDVVDITTAAMSANSSTMYLNATFYDYYTTLQMKYDSTSGYWLDDSTSDVYGSTPDKDKTTDRNFFPFNSSAQSAKSQQLNYGFATKLEFTFRLTEDGTVVSSEQEDIPIEFNFSGDDDVWVFIDGQLALDVGGGHGRVSGYLNFRDKTYYVSVNNVSGTAVDDGRTEEYATGATDGHTIENSYKGTKPDANTFVFRSFSNPDNAVSATKLKVVFTNKVKTGSLTIHKKQAGSVDLTGEFTFYVVFTNVGGMSLESNPITVGPFKLSAGGTKTISGIPLNTEYAIYEIKPEDEEITLDHVKVGGAEVTYTVTTYGDSSAYMTTGTVTANDSDNSHTVEYYNINKPVVSLTLTKKWEGVDKDEDRPRSIRVQLQYSMDEGNTWNPIEGYYKDRTIGPGYAKWSDYTYTFADLDKYKYDEDGNDEAEYMYRVVELDSEGKVIDADGTVTIGGVEFKVSYGTTGMADLVPDTTNEYTQTITNTVIPTVTLKITKLDATDQTKLAGVVFKLEKDGSTIGTQTTGTDGIATFAELKAGSYTLTETKTAEGYSLLKSAITVVIANDGTATVDGNNANITTGTDGVKTIELTIYNKKNLSMPSTGGVYGFEYWILGGLCITAVPLLLYTLFGFKKGGKYRRR